MATTEESRFFRGGGIHFVAVIGGLAGFQLLPPMMAL
jgi:hypothetical protein